MALNHGNNTVILVNGTNLSAYTKNSKYGRKADIEKVTPYGKNSVVKAGSLLDATFDMNGNYDTTASTGPRALLQPLIGQSATVIRRPEGTGAGKPQDSFTAILASYEETSPADGYVMWAATWEISDDINSAAQ